ncbi:class I SAM-dependent methyltransferase [Pseudohalocynthiibacter aestuariivivens]|jgi:cyclopropane-fatty-acyl-phospholipid synthase|uniref:Class I SAM-dependent methyltransferase n=1 Tax=Pseudohalocynthiibacter aestuariivivens TaxID=1591409 RepID=A0ABV5JDZ4_9RHOB|nr:MULTISPECIES: cyclopropane-fatty-acyl-phospholipid synthase family protein [Pseudohalocynthiibacter]MBS9717160.1 class I SAM-dependent methyltransferase [Pseudohalocynthiibacter aestuariivivens]MCK0103737.1 cyclopropane-fatty-acyl-phospholipid synthase family protein [Pseudohalocynthiibacter sp. F2068]
MWEALFVRMLKQLIRHGTLDLQLPSGRKERFGDGDGSVVIAQITDPGLPRRFMINPELTIGEAYMEGTLNIDNDDLHSFIALGIRNMSVGRGHGLERFFGPFLRYVSQYNPMGRARSNVAHHYDLSGALYDLFLDEDKQYSCAYFRHPDDTLEQAQIQKKAHIAQKLCLEPGMRVLDIGCGWGGMAITLAKDYGVHVVGVTLSEEQHKVARARVDAAGLNEQIDIRLTDYRALDGKFDRVVSVGMFEHVGVPHYREYFSHVSDRLTDNGIALIHTIGRESPPGRTSPWVLKYIFPGGYVPSLSEVSKAIEKEGLWTTDVEVWQLHYAETLKHWYTRFMANIDKARQIYDDRFCRMWRFYLISAELTFRLHRQVVFQFQLTRKQGVVPLTRDYIYQGDEKQHWRAAE